MLIYQRISNFITKYRLVVYGLLIALLFGACFFMPFVIVATATILLFSIFLPLTYVLNLYLFIHLFEILFKTNTFNHQYLFFNILQVCLITNILVQHVIIAIKNKAKCNYLPLALLSVFGLYIILPPHIITYPALIRTALQLLLIYIVYQERERIDFTAFTKTLTYALTISIMFGALKPYAGRLANLIPNINTDNGFLRETGLFNEILPVLTLLCILRLYHKINNVTFCYCFSIIFMFAIKLVSRDRLITMALTTIIFVIFYILKYKKTAIKPLLCLLVCLGTITVFCLEPFAEVLGRTANTISSEFEKDESYTNEIFNGDFDYEQIINGEIHYDPGRIGLWKLYAKVIFSSPQILFLGKGISAPFVGQMTPHNIFLLLLYQHGLIGIGIMIATILCFVKIKNLKISVTKHFLPLLIFLIPCAFSLLFDTPIFLQNYIFYLLLILAVQFIADQERPTVSQIPPITTTPSSTPQN